MLAVSTSHCHLTLLVLYYFDKLVIGQTFHHFTFDGDQKVSNKIVMYEQFGVELLLQHNHHQKDGIFTQGSSSSDVGSDDRLGSIIVPGSKSLSMLMK